ncbi:Fic family protein [Arthrobacter sp. H5]|uniref:Fic/DOC family protein n=1 Tax=Arthrobacter sp. H5 TaxID=1267973 RepID=UPI001C1E293F|nr:Fic family protein [Arthrobacter sp. H5]
MKSIHGYLFQDVYDWAGQQRVGPDNRMTKEGPDVLNFAPGDPQAPVVAYGYYAGPQITEAVEHQYAALAKEQHLQGLGPEQFVERLAEHWGELNTIHAFREGNTRTQFIFFEQLASDAGYLLDTTKFEPGQRLRDEFVLARFHNQATASTGRLASVLSEAISTERLVAESVSTATAGCVRWRTG